ncbi:YcgN family cysteine cluster protein [uncultured Cohaesibacter sp.]|uniref:YcgN family cysteine cluster protein n=1 Tax=uncultured Cohaesibacter sp. TaxID=1002546 RepID=UPI002AA678BB|nr:YcgN family cysteine cluster protein [uncultured Cohaesibacter sp.]
MTDKKPDLIATVDPTAEYEKPFWQVKRLDEMSKAEWESLCDGCARCCLNKLEDWDTGEIIWTNVSCSLLDSDSCRCKDYHNRLATIPDCVPLDAEKVASISWLPPTCAYRLLEEGYDLYWWHPLVSGDPDTIHKAGISVRGRVVSEEGMEVEDYEDHLANWPGEDPDDEPVVLNRNHK